MAISMTVAVFAGALAVVPAGAVAINRREAEVLRATKPHIIFVLADDLGYHDVGFRNSGITTPTIDRLASEGRVLDNYYVQPSCAPTRATIMTGRHTTSHGIIVPFDNNKSAAVSFEDTLFPEVLSSWGYVCHAVGKWHLGFFRWDATPTFRGFSSFYGFYGQGQNYMSHKYRGAFDFRRDEGRLCGMKCSIVEKSATQKYSTELFTTRTVKLIDEHDTRLPLFLYLAWQAVHAPTDSYCPSSVMNRLNGTERDVKFACTLMIADDGLGQIVAALRRRDMLRNTLIVFSSDNGGAVSTSVHKEDDVGASNFPLRGGKHTLFEGGVRSVGFIWAGWWVTEQTKLHPLYKNLMGSVDWFPTLLEAAGIWWNNSIVHNPIEGVSHWRALSSGPDPSSSGEPPRDTLLVAMMKDTFDSHDASYAFRHKQWKLISGKPCSQTSAWGWSGPQGSLLVNDSWPNYTFSTRLLYDVEADPEERHDLAASQPEVLAYMMQLLEPHLQRIPQYMWMPTFVAFIGDQKLKLDGAPIDGIWQPWTVAAQPQFRHNLAESLVRDAHVGDEERALQPAAPFGAVIVTQEGLNVTAEAGAESGQPILCRLGVGERVEVMKVSAELVDGMVRGLIVGSSGQAGWISLGESSKSLFIKREVIPHMNQWYEHFKR